MKLLLLDSIEKSVFGGYENWIRLVARHFSEAGHSVTVAGREGSEYLRRVSDSAPKATMLPLDISGDFNPVTISKLRSYIDQNNIEIVTANFNKDVRLGGLAARWQGNAKLVWRLGLDVTKDKFIHKWLTPKLVDAVIVPSQALKHQVMRFGYLTDEMIRVIYNGSEYRPANPDPDGNRKRLHEKYNLPEDSIVALSSGRFVDQKGHVYLTEAVPSILKAHPQVKFLWLGNGPLQEQLETRLNELGVADSVIFAGMLDEFELEFLGADLMIHSAIEEPFSHSIVEGLRAGLPIVASRVGGIPEAVDEGNSAYLVEAKKPEELAEAINRLLSEPDKMRAFGACNRKRWEDNFRVEKMLERTEEYFNEVLARN